MSESRMQTYLLLRLERAIFELRRQKRMSRATSDQILKWIDERLSRQQSPLFGSTCLRIASLCRRRSSQSSQKVP
jgi:hypothetical protein